MTPANLAAAFVFGLTFLGLALGRIGQRNLPRGLVSLVGGLVTALLLKVPFSAIDLDVIALLAGLMVLAGLAESAGLFSGLRRRLILLRPGLALWLMLLVVAVASAVLLNDAAVVVLVPFLLPVVFRLGLPAVPAVVLLAVAANVGSLLTPFGNPQNAVLAAHADLSVLDFLRNQSPIAIAGLAVLAIPCHLLGRRAVARPDLDIPHSTPLHRWPLAAFIALFVVAAVVPNPVGLGATAAAVAFLAWLASRWLDSRRADAAAWKALDWNVLLLFVGLYLLTDRLDAWFPTQWLPFARMQDPWTAGLATTAFSNFVGNVPAILTYQALDPVWTLDHANYLVTLSTLGGTLLLTGSAASLLAAEQAKKSGIQVGFGAYLAQAIWVLPVLVAGAWWTWYTF